MGEKKQRKVAIIREAADFFLYRKKNHSHSVNSLYIPKSISDQIL
ncbi:MAG: hypothetical protein ACTSR8_19490 [Promethearchaeota archaeon]